MDKKILFLFVCIFITVLILVASIIRGNMDTAETDTDCVLCATCPDYDDEGYENFSRYNVRLHLVDDIDGTYVFLDTSSFANETILIEDLVEDYPEIIIILFEEPGGYSYWVKDYDFNTLHDFSQVGVYRFFVTEKCVLFF